MANDLAFIEERVRGLEPVFNSVLVDQSIDFGREVEFAMQVLSANEYTLKVAASSQQSLLDAITNVAAIGISLNPATKQAYLVPRKGRICLDISYMGLIDMATASGSVRWAQSVLVYAKDKFSLNGYDRAPTHIYEPFDEDRGPLVGVYAVAKTADGDFLTHTMKIKDVFAIRDRSESYKSGNKSPWRTDEGEMVRKTCIKQASKYWPKTERLDKAIHHLNTEADEGLADLQPEQPATSKPVVTMPQARPTAPQDVTDVVDKTQPAQSAEQQPTPPADAPPSPPATDGEVLYVTKRLERMGLSLADALLRAGLADRPSLKGITKAEFEALKGLR